MSLAILYSRASLGIDAPLITIEVHISLGLPGLSIVGLPETAIKESKDRVRSALMNVGFEFPARRITINLAPADLPKKEGGRFDLPIALGILAASDQLHIKDFSQYEFAGELALDGNLRTFNGALPFALATKRSNRILVLPATNAAEAALVSKLTILSLHHLLDICHHLGGTKTLTPLKAQLAPPILESQLDLIDIRGQQYAKRALEIAAAGQHSLLFAGPPGTGKTMLANRLTTILPPMSENEALETAAIYSISGKKFNPELWRLRTFRSPHHTASSVALVGGSSPPRPGEISLAHNGVLFLDELPEFNRAVLEALREPLESGYASISRAAHQAKFPARFQLVAAMNPCPCGYLGDTRSNCRCTQEQIQRYKARISGPLLDRIDIFVAILPLPKNKLLQPDPNAETSAQVLKRVEQSRQWQLEHRGKLNSHLYNKEIAHFCQLQAEDQEFLESTLDKLNLSARACHRILKVARTIADLAESEEIQREHLTEAIKYRRL